MWDALSAPFRALIGFFEISVIGALGYVVGVVGFVFIPSSYKLLCAMKAPKFAAVPLAVLLATTAGGVLLILFMGGMGGGIDFDRSVPDVPTHPMAVEKLNACPPATKLLDKPIKMTAVGKGSYQTRGAFGTSSWNLDVAGPHKTGKAVYAMEMHGGKWGFTGLAIEVDGKQTDLAGCMTAVAAAELPRVASATKDQLVGLWGTDRGNSLMLTRFEADEKFVAGMFVDEKKVAVVRGTWEVADGYLIWHYDRARSDAPQAMWDQIGDERLKADRNAIVSLSKTKLAIQEASGSTTEMRPTDPARLGSLLAQMPD